MNTQKFELFMGCLGNGVTVCNKAVEENGDYKTIAHIGENGKIKWYVKPGSIPGKALLRIEHEADAMYSNYKNWWDNLPIAERYSRLLDVLPHNIFMEVVSDKTSTMEQNIEQYEKEYILGWSQKGVTAYLDAMK